MKAIRYETNIGLITVADYYGFIYFIEDGKNSREFIQAAFNTVKDGDVMP